MTFARLGFQLFLDTVACYAAYKAYETISLGEDFFGRGVILFVFAAVTFNYALAFLSNSVAVAISFNSVNRFGTNAAAYLEAIKNIAGQEDIDAVTKVTRVIDSIKITRTLEAMDTMLKERAEASGKKGSVSTLESLSVFLTLDKARKELGFNQEEFDLKDSDAFSIARMFSQYDTNDDLRLDQREFQQLCADVGRDLDTEEAEAALSVIDLNGSGFVEFNEFVQFWVDPKGALGNVDKKLKPAETEKGKEGAEKEAKAV